jgi:5-methylcytosine-specific restriction endonuclease McrA
MPTRDARIHTAAWRGTRLIVLVRDRYQCQIRGPHCKGYATEVDHIVEREHGGNVLDLANLRAACKPCNVGRHNQGRTPRPAKRRRAVVYKTTVARYETRL